MARLKYLLLLFLTTTCLFAQETNDCTPKYYQLTSDQYKAWKSIEDEWMKKEYRTILKENKLKMTCAGCESIYMDVVFIVDTRGTLIQTKTLKTRKCAGEFSKKLEERFLKWFLNFSFPAQLYNLKFEVRLGTGLKC